jgi:prolyl 4-hydroxylase
MSPDALEQRRQAAARGEPEAVAFSAVLAALGAGEPADWTVAVERLRRAAALGSDFARRQLAVLEPEGAPFDLGAWLQPAERERRLRTPRINTVAGLVSPRVCQWLIGRATGRLSRAAVFDVASGQARVEDARSNSAFEFELADLDVVLLLVRARIAATVGTVTGALETTQILHYAPGQAFGPHFDFLDPSASGFASEIERRGQRVATALVYLNDDYVGGETEFPRAGLRFKGRAGEALMFANVDVDGRPDELSLHAGCPTVSGEKWVLSQWIRDRAPA